MSKSESDRKADVLNGLQNVFDNVFMTPVTVTPELTAKDVDEWDSLSHVVLVLGIEDEFKIRFSVGEVESAKNVGDLVDIIIRKGA